MKFSTKNNRNMDKIHSNFFATALCAAFLFLMSFSSFGQTVTTIAVDEGDLTSTSAVLKGHFENNEGMAVTSYGFKYSDNAMSLSNDLPADYTGDPFSATLTGLTPGTTYYYRAYVYTDAQGQINGSVESFTTPTGSSNPTAGGSVNWITIGGGPSVNTNLPVNIYYKYSLSQQIYTPAEIGRAGTIERIAFYNNTDNIARTIDLYMFTSDRQSFTSTTDWETVSSSDLVFSGEVTFLSGEWTEIALTTPFEYDGVSNIIVVTDDNTAYDATTQRFLTFEASGQSIYVNGDDTDFNPTDLSGTTAIGLEDVKNQIKLGFTSTNPTFEYVDLGLPSGTKWATMNIGAERPEDFGTYFAWGETSPKTVYDWESYIYADGDSDSDPQLTKYCNDSGLGITDALTELETGDDAATAILGSNWRMPTYDEVIELRDYCEHVFTTQNGVAGTLVTGPNNQSIFIPAAAGRYYNNEILSEGTGSYWSSSLDTDDPTKAQGLSLASDGFGTITSHRYFGLPIRPVYDPSNTAGNFTPAGLEDYEFTTGSSDGTIYLPSFTQLIQSGQDDQVSELTDIGFTFTYDEVEYTQFSVNSNGRLRLGNEVITTEYNNPFTPTYYNQNTPAIVGVGTDLSTGADGYVQTGLYGSSGSYIRVVEFMLATSASATSDTYIKFQVQLYEATGEVRIAYDEYENAPSGYQIGIGNADATKFWYVDPNSHTATYATEGTETSYSTHPGVNRYYSFAPPVRNNNSNSTGSHNGHDYVDLGLSVKWATVNVGATSPDEEGNLYAWGETQTKSMYDWINYRHCEGYADMINKYFTDESIGVTAPDDLTTLLPEDDAVTASWGAGWRMPTADEVQELINNCTIDGSTINGNGNSITLNDARYWTSSLYLDNQNNAYLYDNSSGSMLSYSERSSGYPVRGVYDATLATPTVTTKMPDNVTESSATLQGTYIVDPETPEPTSFGFLYGTDTTATLTEVSATFDGSTYYIAEVTGLSSGTTYYCKFFAENSNGRGYGQFWEFETQGAGTANTTNSDGIIYQCDFENGSEDNWPVLNNGDQTNHWAIGLGTSDASTTDTHSLYITNDNSSYNYNNTAPSSVYAYKEISLPARTNYRITFDWKCTGENNYDFLRAFLIPTSENPNLSAGNSLGDGYENANNTPDGWIDLYYGQMESSDNQWQQADRTMALNGGNYYLVFYWHNDGSSGSNPPAAVDNIFFYKLKPISVTANNVTDKTSTSATLNGSIAFIDDPEDIPAGFKWGNSQTSLSNNLTTQSTGATFSAQLTDLTPQTTYYYRAYAVYEGDTAYSDIAEFRTALDEDAPGGANNPLLISDINDWQDFTEALGSYTIGTTYKDVVLYDYGQDIYFSLVSDLSFTDAGTTFTTQDFRGNLNGNNNTITIEPNQNFTGIFSTISYGHIDNLNLRINSSVTLEDASMFGVLCQKSYDASISNCTVSSISDYVVLTIESSETQLVGGLVGEATNTTISSCTNNLKITSDVARVGGIAGKADGTIMYCTNNAELSGAYVGGIMAEGAATITNCLNTGRINCSDEYAGGISGSGGNISTCMNIGEISATGTKKAGGIVGNAESATVTNCANYGAVTSFSSNMGGIAGFSYGNGTFSHNVSAPLFRGTEAPEAENEIHATVGGMDVTETDDFFDEQVGDIKVDSLRLRFAERGTHKPTAEIVGSALSTSLSSEYWDFTEGIYPKPKYIDETSQTIAARIPIYLGPHQSVFGVWEDFTMPTTIDGQPVTWESDNTSTISISNGTATVNRPADTDVSVMLTASYQGYSKWLTLTVIGPKHIPVNTNEAWQDSVINLRASFDDQIEGVTYVYDYGFQYSTTSADLSEDVTTVQSNNLHYEASAGFSYPLANIPEGTMIYYRAYATTADGTEYGDILTHKALGAPVVVAKYPMWRTDNSATIELDITLNDGEYDDFYQMETRNVYYGTDRNNLTLSEYIDYDADYHEFSVNLHDLAAETKYYYVAEVTNDYGTTRSDTLEFLTYGTMTDSSDYSHYYTIKIGNQIWMAQNLKSAGQGVSLGTTTSETEPYYYYVNGDESNTDEYGYLYNWAAAMNGASSSTDNPSGVQGICPNGWHLPSDAEWTQLTDYLGGTGNAGVMLAGQPAAQGQYWQISDMTMSVNFGQSGFNALPAGSYVGTNYSSFGSSVSFWSATENTSVYAYDRSINYESTSMDRNYNNKVNGNSVRCLKNLDIIVATNNATNITPTSAVLNGSISNAASSGITARGFMFGTDSENLSQNLQSTDNTADFTYTLSDLTTATTYYFKAYATINGETMYGDVKAFMIPSGVYNNYGYVDLGLPSGTLWATTNVGASTPEGYGDYYAWGETEPKDEYTWSTYQHANGSESTLTKYCNEEDYGNNGFVDNLTTLDLEDDAAAANWGTGWRMPTKNEMDELYNSCTSEFTTQNGVTGVKFTAPNGNTVFFPISGVKVDNSVRGEGEDALYWSNMHVYSDQNLAYCYSLNHIGGDVIYSNNMPRYVGYSVRAIFQKSPVVVTKPVTDQNTVTITLQGKVASSGISDVNARGFIYGTDSENLTDSIASTDNTDEFTALLEISNLLQGRRYYYRAFAANDDGVSYGEILSFRTVGPPEIKMYHPEWRDTTSVSLKAYIEHDGEINSNKFYIGVNKDNLTEVSGEVIYNDTDNTISVNAYDLLPATLYWAVAESGDEYGSSKGDTISFYTYGHFKDVRDNTDYKTIKIGDQTWMAENLRYAGDLSIGNDTSSTVAYRYYPNGNESNAETYGYLYNWKAAMNGENSSDANPSGVQGICPDGWHLPSNAEWTQLETALGSTKTAAKLAGSASTWICNNGDCSMLSDKSFGYSGFNAVPSGVYYQNYYVFGKEVAFWSTTQFNETNIYTRYLYTTRTEIVTSDNETVNGYNVRCVKVSTIYAYDTVNYCGEQYTFGTQTLTATGDYEETFTLGTDKDSIVYLHLTMYPALVPTISDFSNGCYGENNGYVEVGVSGGAGTYTYNWSTPDMQTDARLSNLADGEYTVTVTDAAGCSATISQTITAPAELTATISGNNPNCYGDQTTLTASANGGTTDYSYAWSSGESTSSITVSPTATTTYTVTVTDANNCSVAASKNIVVNTQLTVSVSGDTQVQCFGDNTATLTATASGGSMAIGYTYTWSNSQSGQNITGVGAGTYSVTVTDGNGCTASANATVTGPTAALSASTTASSNVSCNGASDGSATVTANGGTPDYTYLWSNNATTPTVNGLAAGTYNVTVTDANSCTAVTNTTITQPEALTVTISGEHEIFSSANVCAGAELQLIASIEDSQSTYETPYYAWERGMNEDPSDTNSPIIWTRMNFGDYGREGEWATCDICERLAFTNCEDISYGANDGFENYNDITIVEVQSPTAPAYTHYYYRVIVAGSVDDLNGNICISTSNTFEINVTRIAEIEFGGTNAICEGGVINLAVTETSPAGTWSIYAENGNTGGPFNASITNSGTNYSVVNAVHDEIVVQYTTSPENGGCWNQKTIPIYSLPEVTITPENTTICEGTDVTLHPSSNQQSSFQWSGGPSCSNTDWASDNTCADWTVNPITTTTYTLTVTTSHDLGMAGVLQCESTESKTVTVSPAIELSVTTNNITCNGANNGNAIVNVTNGTAPYTYEWSNGQTNAQTTNLSTGTYTVTVRDNNGCSVVESLEITQPDALTTSLSATSILCNGQTSNITNTVAGGTPNYTYNWNNGSTTQNLEGVGGGTYSVTVTDANSCVATASVTVNEPEELTSELSAGTIACNGSTTDITNTVSGGTTPITYEWNNGANTQNLTGVVAGTYSVTVRDNNSCSVVREITITQPDILTTSLSAGTIACNGGTTGITNTPDGGTTPYQYYWSNSSNEQTLSGVSAGTYTVTVRDNNGCSVVESLEITQPNALTTSLSATSILCNGQTSNITNTVAGGTPNYTYNWNNGSTTQNLEGVGGGTYSVTVTDANSCVATASVTVNEPEELTSELSAGTIACNGSTTDITNTVSGGTTPITYEWNNGANTQNLTGVVAGTYSVTVRDNNSCSVVREITITQPNVLAVSVDAGSVACNGSTTTASAVVSGGTEPYEYQWSNSATTQTITDIIAGTYSVTVTDDNGCSTNAFTTITQPEELTVSISGPTSVCQNTTSTLTANVQGGTADFTYSWSNSATTSSITTPQLTTATEYSVTVTDANNCSASASVNVEIGDTPGITIADVTPICAGGNTMLQANVSNAGTGYTVEWSSTDTGAGLPADITTDAITVAPTSAGTYTYTVSLTATSCSDGQPFNSSANVTLTVNALPDAAITNNTNATTITCSTTQISLTATGGTAYQWSNGGAIADNNITSADTYTVTVTDANGCSNTESIVITEDVAAPTVSITNTTGTTLLTCTTTTINVEATGTGTSYLWSNEVTTATNAITTGGTYTVTATADNGCTSTAAIEITPNSDAPSLSITNNTGETELTCALTSISVTATGSGASYEWSNGVETAENTLTAPGTYTVTATAGNGCSASEQITITQDIAAPEIIASATDSTICQGASTTISTTGGNSYTWSPETGLPTTVGASITATPTETITYTVTGIGTNGCTGSGEITITVNLPTSSEFSDTACDSYEWNGTTYDQSGDFTQTFINANGCDSVVTLHLTINHSSTGIDEQTACDSYEWIDGMTYTESTDVPTFTLRNAEGCDSVVTLHLTINNSQTNTVEATACDSYEWADETYTESGTYNKTFTAANGCDSVVTVHLTINHAVTGIDRQEACETFTWIDGNTYTESTDSTNAPTFTLQNTEGCDSVVSLYLVVNRSTTSEVSAQMCSGVPYTYEGETFTEAGTYTVTLTNSHGCDSIVTLTITYANNCGGIVSGVVTDENSGEPISNARVTVGNQVTRTNAEGQFSIDVLRGRKALRVSATGYISYSNMVDIQSDTAFNISLNAPHIETDVDSLAVSSYPYLEQSDSITISNTGSGTLVWSSITEYDNLALVEDSVIQQRSNTRSLWDSIQTFATRENAEQAIATDGFFIYTSSWMRPGEFNRYTPNGEYVETFYVENVGSIRNLSYDGTHFYGTEGTNIIFKLDLDNQTLVDSIETDIPEIRHCSFNRQDGSLLAGSWNSLYRIDIENGTSEQIRSDLANVYSSAFDNLSPGGPYLWLFSQTSQNNGPSAYIRQFNISTGEYTDRTHYLDDINLSSTSLAGGICASEYICEGKFVLLADVQNPTGSNTIATYEIGRTNNVVRTGKKSGSIAPNSSENISVKASATETGDYSATIRYRAAVMGAYSRDIDVNIAAVAPECDAVQQISIATDTFHTVTLEWQPVELGNYESVSYLVFNTASQFAVDTVSGTTVTYDGLPVGNHCFCVMALSQAGYTCLSAASDTVCAEIQDIPCNIPLVVEARSDGESVTVSWNMPVGVDYVSLYRYSDPIDEHLTTTSYIDTNVVPETDYCYIVIAHFENGICNEITGNACIRIAADVCTEAPVLTADAVSGSVALEWTESNGAVNYRVFRDETFVGATSGTTYIDNISESGNYCYRVESICEYGMFASSDEVCLSVEIITDDGEGSGSGEGEGDAIDEWTADNLTLYPNPTYGQFFIEGQRIAVVQIFNASGMLVTEIENTEAERITINCDGWNPGLYNIRIISAEGESATRKVTIFR